jgi:hypothetical protein
LSIAADIQAQSPGRRRAVVIGINDYTASRLATTSPARVPDRDWRNLSGAVTDATLLSEMLPLIYGFESRDVVTLTDQAATREVILRAIENTLLEPAQKGDILLFYFAGHGSQVRNSLSMEPDKLDETIVPADSRLGARDIRDKELRALFNRILDRGARLTVILDNCHSGSGARGLTTGLRPRGVKADLRDIADGAKYGPRPEDRGALVLSATQDFDAAWEMRDQHGRFHGAFSWALLRAMREAESDEPACDTFLRAQARLRGATPYQEPVIAGTSDMRLEPLLAARTDRRGGRAIVAVEKVRDDGTILLNGGWANGLDAGTELRVATESRMTQRVVITAIEGLSRSEARVQPRERPVPLAIHSGALLEVVGWAAPAGRTMRVSMPRIALDVRKLTALAVSMHDAAASRNVRWVANPLTTTPAHVLRRAMSGWDLVDGNGDVEAVGDDAAAVAAIAKLPPGSSIFVQFPAPAAIVDGMAVGVGTDCEGIEPVESPEMADYVLVGRYCTQKISYSWVRPLVKRSDRRKSGLPERTSWVPLDNSRECLRVTLAQLRDDALTLRRIHAWQILESPQHARSPYRLALRRERDDELVRDESIRGGESYGLLLRLRHMPPPEQIAPRYTYVFVIDSNGNSELLFPAGGSSVENRLPQAPATPEIVLDTTITIDEPYGIDTYFLLTTDEPLPNPFVLTWRGVRTRAPEALTPLEQLLAMTGSTGRGSPFVTPATWSIERLVCESIPPRKRRK